MTTVAAPAAAATPTAPACSNNAAHLAYALLVRGEAYRFGCDERSVLLQDSLLLSQQEMVVASLEECAATVDVLLAVDTRGCANSTLRTRLGSWFRPSRLRHHHVTARTQPQNVRASLDLFALERYDVLIVTRYDLRILQPYRAWPGCQSLDRIGVANRCEAMQWDKWNCSSDVIFVVPRDRLWAFNASVGQVLDPAGGHWYRGTHGGSARIYTNACFASAGEAVSHGIPKGLGHGCYNALAARIGPDALDFCFPGKADYTEVPSPYFQCCMHGRATVGALHQKAKAQESSPSHATPPGGRRLLNVVVDASKTPFPDAASGWRLATRAELALALTPEQYDGAHDPLERRERPAAPQCNSSFKYACLGSCQKAIKGYNLRDSRSAAYVYDPGGARPQPIDAHAGLRTLLGRALEDGSPCSVGFSGDSVIHDIWSAAVSGAMRLGFTPTRCVCSAGIPTWHALQGSSPLCPSDRSQPGACYAVLNTSGAELREAAQTDCAVLTLHYYQIVPAKHLAALPAHHRPIASPQKVLSSSSVVVHHVGLLHANDESEAQFMLDRHFAPLVQAVEAASAESSWVFGVRPGRPRPSRARLLWLETMPQHFRTRTGSGLFSDALHRQGPHPSCPQIANESAAAWRNAFFARWSQPWRERALLAGASTAEDGRSRLLFKAPLWMDVPLFDALLPRGDMHPALECTHWCYSPFLYAAHFDAVAAAMEQYDRKGGGAERAHGHRHPAL